MICKVVQCDRCKEIAAVEDKSVVNEKLPDGWKRVVHDADRKSEGDMLTTNYLCPKCTRAFKAFIEGNSVHALYGTHDPIEKIKPSEEVVADA